MSGLEIAVDGVDRNGRINKFESNGVKARSSIEVLTFEHIHSAREYKFKGKQDLKDLKFWPLLVVRNLEFVAE